MGIVFLGMSEKKKLTIYHLYRKDGSALFLHPFSHAAKLLDIMQNPVVEGKYGKEPRVESLTLFRNEVYRKIEEAVKSWVSESRFTPKFLISAGIFLVCYLVMTFLIRDPLPILDEIAIGLGVSIVAYILLGRRDMRSALALRKRVDLRTVVDRIKFIQSPFVARIETALHRNESESIEKILEYMTGPPESNLSAEDEEDARQLMGYLRKRFDSREFRRQEKVLARISDEHKGVKDFEMLKRWAQSKKIDLSLFAVYTRIKRDVEKVK